MQLLLPTGDSNGIPYSNELLAAISQDLVRRFGGVTAYSRSPAKGQWLNRDHVECDEVIEVEVMTEAIDRDWWKAFREKLESDLEQQELVIRSHAIERL